MSETRRMLFVGWHALLCNHEHCQRPYSVTVHDQYYCITFIIETLHEWSPESVNIVQDIFSHTLMSTQVTPHSRYLTMLSDMADYVHRQNELNLKSAVYVYLVQMLGIDFPPLRHVSDIIWLSGRTSVSGLRSFAVLHSTCSWWVTTYVGKPSTIGQPTRPTQPFILSGSINE